MQTPSRTAPTQSLVNSLLAGTAIAWALAVSMFAARGDISNLVGPQYAMLVATGILAPTLLYALIPTVRRAIAHFGLYPLTVLHLWRIPAALLFFWYGAKQELPPAFWIPAATGDFLVGLYAMRLLWRPGDVRFYRRFHTVGFADFVIAVGLGLLHTLVGDSRMAPVGLLPLALIPLFGVGLSGASHLVAFHLLWRSRRTPAEH